MITKFRVLSTIHMLLCMSAAIASVFALGAATEEGHVLSTIGWSALFLLSLIGIFDAPGGIRDIASDLKSGDAKPGPVIPHEHDVLTSTERLVHMNCGACKGRWTVGDAPERGHWFCTWCGERLTVPPKDDEDSE